MTATDIIRQEAAGRAAVYGFLARLFSEEIDESALSALRDSTTGVLEALGTLGVDAGTLETLRSMGTGHAGASLLDLAVEYAGLFETHNKVYPFASCWVPNAKPVLLGPPAAAAHAFYAEHGVGLDAAQAHRIDHVGTELSFVALLAGRIVDAPDDEIEEIHDAYHRFMSEIVIWWMPRFFDAVIADPRASFYAAAARAAKRFVEADAEALGLEAPARNA